MTPFDHLHPALQHHIVNSLGWRNLRPLQENSIEPILAGSHALLVAPTAGGKTEAAVFPLFSRMLSEDWSGLSVLYICPLRALLNNLEPRLAGYLGLLGRRAALWHGDVGASARRDIQHKAFNARDAVIAGKPCRPLVHLASRFALCLCPQFINSHDDYPSLDPIVMTFSSEWIPVVRLQIDGDFVKSP